MDHEGADQAQETKACRLFLDGYRAERRDKETVVVQNPDGTRHYVNTLFATCTCEEAVKAAESRLCEQQAYEDALVASLEAQYDTWSLTLESDRTERTLREIGVCEF